MQILPNTKKRKFSNGVQKIAIIANLNKRKVPGVVRKLVNYMEKKNVEIFLLKDAAEHIKRKDLKSDEEKIRKNAQVLISLGGDGTLLKSARIVQDANIPILGVNMGGLGFLAKITYRDLNKALILLFQKKYSIEKRSMLAVKVSRNAKKLVALNDVVLSRGSSARIVELKTFIDGNYLTTFASDGLIISTSTGSTAHSLSSGGPIIHPSVDCILIVPICPHALSNRPIVVPKQSRIKVKILTKNSVDYTVDGQLGGRLEKGGEIEIESAPFNISLVKFKEKSFYELLRKKLKWSGYSIVGK
jgi:NAD+ kinase